MFPVSWIVQAAQADVATIVEENVAGVRVVKSFAAEQRPGPTSWPAPPSGCGGRRSTQVDIRARYAPLMENLPRLGLALVLLYGGKLAIDGADHRRRRSSRSTPTS